MDGDDNESDTMEIILNCPLTISPAGYKIQLGDIVTLPASYYRLAQKQFTLDLKYYIFVPGVRRYSPSRTVTSNDENKKMQYAKDERMQNQSECKNEP